MSNDECARQVSMGFAESKVPEGTHMCLIYTSEEERLSSLTKFILSGLEEGDRCACFSSKTNEDDIREFLSTHAHEYDEHKKCGNLSMAGTREVYIKDDCFDPDRMLGKLKDFYTGSIDDGYKGARVIGEMIPEVEKVPGGDRLLEYESRVSKLVQSVPITAVCQYDANVFDGATVMEILKVHPKMIVNGAIVQNPFYIEPDIYLKSINA